LYISMTYCSIIGQKETATWSVGRRTSRLQVSKVKKENRYNNNKSGHLAYMTS